MELKKILTGIKDIKTKGDLEIDIPNICNNSKQIKKGDMFIAIKGFESDGHEYIKEAIDKGAKAVMIDLDSNVKRIKNSR